MKWQLCFIAGVTLQLASCSSSEFEIKESEVPPNVLAAFRAKFPTAQETKWQAEKEDGQFRFEVDFKNGGKEKEVEITPDGSSVSEND